MVIGKKELILLQMFYMRPHYFVDIAHALGLYCLLEAKTQIAERKTSFM